MRNSEKLDQLLLALAKARPNFGEIKKSGFNAHFGQSYAEMSDILAAVELPLAAEGLNFIGTLEYLDPGLVEVTQRLIHVSEQYLESVGRLSYPVGQLQKLGTDVSYFRRYAVNTMLCLSAEADTDGERSPAPLANKKTVRRPSPPVHEPVAASDAATSINGGHHDTIPTGKPTLEEVEYLWQLMRDAYGDEGVVEGELRSVLKLPTTVELKTSRMRGVMTRDMLNRLSSTALAYAAGRDSPITDDLDVADTFPSQVDVTASKPPELPSSAIDDDGLVVKEWVDVLPRRATYLGEAAEEKWAQIQEEYPAFTKEDWSAQWVVLGQSAVSEHPHPQG